MLCVAWYTYSFTLLHVLTVVQILMYLQAHKSIGVYTKNNEVEPIGLFILGNKNLILANYNFTIVEKKLFCLRK